MEKKRRLLLLLCLFLIVIGITIGSVGWFTTRTEISSNLKINTGTLTLQTDSDDKWVLEHSTTSEVTNKNAENDFQNVRPGDSFLKTINLKNTGTLRQKLTFTMNQNLPSNISDIFYVELPTEKSSILEPNQTKSLQIRLLLKGLETKNDNQKKTIDFNALKATNFIVVDGTQTNVPKTATIDIKNSNSDIVAEIKVNFAEGKIYVTSTGETADNAFAGKDYFTFTLKGVDGTLKSQGVLRGGENAESFKTDLNNKVFASGDIIELKAVVVNRIFINDGTSATYSPKGSSRTFKITSYGLK